ncbi:hypothetical protein EVAR_12890_1 [Eumeta japonica]|uniref:Uncharacterized protein n=1 Tax=Eumeta variegata TaxID=151549 RepID=A0A4C1TVQ9_EUMVA|nr:hypothetical protein EVAR_12890_1 [Eumeta japonica]
MHHNARSIISRTEGEAVSMCWIMSGGIVYTTIRKVTLSSLVGFNHFLQKKWLNLNERPRYRPGALIEHGALHRHHRYGGLITILVMTVAHNDQFVLSQHGEERTLWKGIPNSANRSSSLKPLLTKLYIKFFVAIGSQLPLITQRSSVFEFKNRVGVQELHPTKNYILKLNATRASGAARSVATPRATVRFHHFECKSSEESPLRPPESRALARAA